MILPASYSTGFAPRDDAPLYPQLWRGCVGAWNMGLGPSGNTLRDWSGFGNHGTLTNMDAGTDWVSSRGRWALDFDGINDNVAVADSRQWHQSNFTFCCWAYFRGVGAEKYGTVISKDNGGTNWFFLSRDFQSLSGNLSANFYDGTNNTAVASSQVLSLGVWYHIAITVSANTCTLYINGQEDGTGSIASWTRPTINNYTLGYWNIAGGRAMDGYLDDICIYTRAIPVSLIQLRASRRGIAYEMQDRRWASSAVQTNRRRRLLIGSV